MYDSNNITHYSSIINHLKLCWKQNKSDISRSKLQEGIWKHCRTCRWLIETKLFIGEYMKIPQDTSVFYNFSRRNYIKHDRWGKECPSPYCINRNLSRARPRNITKIGPCTRELVFWCLTHEPLTQEPVDTSSFHPCEQEGTEEWLFVRHPVICSS
jgi:hypothetical protein